MSFFIKKVSNLNRNQSERAPNKRKKNFISNFSFFISIKKEQIFLSFFNYYLFSIQIYISGQFPDISSCQPPTQTFHKALRTLHHFHKGPDRVIKNVNYVNNIFYFTVLLGK